MHSERISGMKQTSGTMLQTCRTIVLSFWALIDSSLLSVLMGQCQKLLSVCARRSWQSEKTPQRSQVGLVLSESSQQQEPDLFPFSLLHNTSIKLFATGMVVGGIKHRVTPHLAPPLYPWCSEMRRKLRQSFCQHLRGLILHVPMLWEAQ